MTDLRKKIAGAIRMTRHGVHTSYMDEADAVLAAIEAEGWQLVPKGATEEMVEAGGFGRASQIYKWMLAAAPRVKP